MEHILTVGITVDDAAVERACVEQISETIMTDVRKAITAHTYVPNYSRLNRLEYALARMVEARIDEFIEANKSDIVNSAAERAAEKLLKSSRFRSAVMNRMVKEKEE